jgi:hypothetical protein
VKYAVLRRNGTGNIATCAAVSRALARDHGGDDGVGNLPIVPKSCSSPLSHTGAHCHSYGEMRSMPLYESALMFAALTPLCAGAHLNSLPGSP